MGTAVAYLAARAPARRWSTRRRGAIVGHGDDRPRRTAECRRDGVRGVV